MKTLVLTPPPPAKPSATRDRSGSGDSYYFPGCRKDTNCNCEMCVASIKATLDLVSSRSTLQQSSLTKISGSRPPKERSAVESGSPIPTTPEAGSRRVHVAASPPLRSTAKSRAVEKGEVKEGRWVSGQGLVVPVFVLCFALAVYLGFPFVVLRISGGAKLGVEMVRRAVEESLVGGDFREKLGILEEKLKVASGGRFSKCSSNDSIWVLDQGDHLLRMKCVLYKSMAEEVSIWGFPLSASGLLVTGLLPRSFTILCGRIRQWSEGKLKFFNRECGSSWTSGRWRTSAVQLEGNTWVLEYHQNSILVQEGRPIPLAWEFLRMRASKLFEELKHVDWFQLNSASFPMNYLDDNINPPT